MIARNAIFLGVGNIAVRAVTAMAAIITVRYLGPDTYGLWSIALSYASISVFFTEFGLTQTLIREGSKEDADLNVILSSGLRLRLLFSLATSVVVVGLVWGAYGLQLTGLVILVVTLPSLWGGAIRGIAQAYYQITERMRDLSVLKVVASLIPATAVIATLMLHGRVEVLALAYGLSILAGGMLMSFFALRSTGKLHGWDPEVLRGIGAFLVGVLIMQASPYIGPLLLDIVSSREEVGHFAAATRIPIMLYQVPAAFAAAAYPRLFKYGHVDSEAHRKTSVKLLEVMSFIGIGIALPIMFEADVVVRVAFGAEWVATTAATLQIVMAVLIAQSISYPLADALTTEGRQGLRVACQAVGMAVSAVLCLILGAHLGAVGAGIAIAIGESTLVLSLLVVSQHRVAKLRHGIGVPLGAGIVAAAVGVVLKDLVSVEVVTGGVVVLVFGILSIVGSPKLREYANRILVRFSK